MNANDKTVIDAGALNQLESSNVTLMRMENENIMALAVQHPRDHESIKNELISQLTAYPTFAAEAIYIKPVGKDGGGKMKYARGLSIRAAEALADAYKYNRIRCEVTPLNDQDAARVEATFTDLQNGRVWQSSSIVSKWYKARRGGMTKHADDRFYSVVVKAEKSRLIREVIVRSVPPGLRAELLKVAESEMAKALSDESASKIVDKFATKNIPLEKLENFLDQPLTRGWNEDHRVMLLQVWTAIDSGEVSIADMFNDSESNHTDDSDAEKPKSQTKTLEEAMEEIEKKNDETKT